MWDKIRNQLMTVVNEIDKADCFHDYESQTTRCNEMGKLFMQMIMMMLPPFEDGITTEDGTYFSDGEQIICATELECDCLLCFLDDILKEFSDIQLYSGSYNRQEDERNEEVNKYTDWWYIGWE